ncbi:MAG: hypothetical protein V2A58_16700, partial [Planctomycetota bacterium]
MNPLEWAVFLAAVAALVGVLWAALAALVRAGRADLETRLEFMKTERDAALLEAEQAHALAEKAVTAAGKGVEARDAIIAALREPDQVKRRAALLAELET